jgi:hypothetical protein
VGSFDDEGSEGCLGAMGAVVGVVGGRGLVHPVQLYLVFNGCDSKFFLTWYFPIYLVACSFSLGTSLSVQLLGCQSCIHCKCPVLLDFQVGCSEFCEVDLKEKSTVVRDLFGAKIGELGNFL